VWLIGAMVCLLAAPWVQLSVTSRNPDLKVDIIQCKITGKWYKTELYCTFMADQ